MTARAFDYTDRIAPSALIAAGCQVVCRYLSRPGWPKNLTRTEADELLAAGIGIVLNFETTADFMLGGYAAGLADARSARAQAAALGASTDARIYYSADFDASSEQIPAVLDYLHGAADAEGSKSLVGAYGGLAIVEAAADAGFACWQTVAWSSGVWDPRAVLRQTGQQRAVGGVTVDVNDIISLDALGAWTPGGSTVGTISPAIGQTWPEIAAQFPANQPFDNDTALIWSDAGARAAALYAKEARDAINALAERIGAPASVNVDALAAALAPHLAAGATADQVAHAVVMHLGADLAAG